MGYLNYIYMTLKAETFDFDAVYEDYILQLIGTVGFEALKERGILEVCGVMHGRKLYTIV